MNALTNLRNSIEDNCLKGTIALRLMKDTSGVTAIEYGLIAALVAIAAIAAMTTLGGNLKNTFSLVASEL